MQNEHFGTGGYLANCTFL